MQHQQRVELYKQYMTESGASLRAAVPSLWAFAWSLGLELPPPPFMSSLGLVLFSAMVFPLLALAFWLITECRPRRRVHIPFSVAAWFALAAGVCGCVLLPIYYRRMAQQYGLVQWSTFTGARQRT